MRLQARIEFRILTSPDRGKKAPGAALGAQVHESSKQGEKHNASHAVPFAGFSRSCVSIETPGIIARFRADVSPSAVCRMSMADKAIGAVTAADARAVSLPGK